MKKLTKKAYEFIDYAVGEVFGGSGIEGARICDDGDNPFAFIVSIPIETDERLVVKTCNKLFHALELLPDGKNLAMGESGDYCQLVRGGDSDGECYVAMFNHPAVLGFVESDPECRFILKNWREWDGGDEEDAEIDRLVEGVKSGRLKSKSPDGYLVLKGEFYDAIEAGRKKVEYRDFTEYNIKRTIGLKTVRFNRGYVKNAPQMKWGVEKVVLMDGDGNECDPFNVPDDFRPATIAIHLGKRLD